ncbi:hypothetical protein BN59_02453 [Legionella massiliensis]|uniref:Uncharacterized protein n=1 Tax=Legionella massiliensis TaxID=1034943 RepID=A0A078KYY0_9GAMM|nr:hypothetical protein [Legionella massiliensis]CDZ78146.1 hypothetical protein BN59_02453 [Legionella massiliensis]CEE13884.1 hypothetical protein BN1094_02453 [Legionella massiliensis]
MQPAVQEALTGIDPSIQEKIALKIYQPPANDKFNRVEVDAMVKRVALDVKILVAAPVKDKFYEDPHVKEFINTLNALAAVRPITAEREAQVERMSEAIVTAVKSFAQNPNVADMSNHLQENYEILQDKYNTTPNYSDVVEPEKRGGS